MRTFFLMALLCLISMNQIFAQSFKQARGGAIDVAISPVDGSVFVVGATSRKVFKYQVRTNDFKQYLGNIEANRIAVRKDGKVWLTKTGGGTIVYQNANQWKSLPVLNAARDLVGGSDGQVWSCFFINGKVISHSNEEFNHDPLHSAKSKRIAVSNRNDFWVIRDDNTLHRFFKGKWSKMPGKATDIAMDIATRKIYVVGMSKRIFIWNDSAKNWDVLPETRSDVVNVAVHNGQVWCTTTDNKIFYNQYSASTLISSGFGFDKRKSKVVILVHGITGNKHTDPSKKDGVDTPCYPKFYWGYDFIRLMLNVNNQQELYARRPNRDLSNRSVNRRLWDNHYTCNFIIDKRIKEERLALMLGNDYRDTEVMCTYRDGSLSLMKQTKATIKQIYDSYQAYYGHLPATEQPMIYLVAHSFGGIVCRTILSNPSGKGRFGERLTASERERADFIRNRTVWLTTLSTPHESSPMPALAKRLDNTLKPLQNTIFGRDAIRTLRQEQTAGNEDALSDIQNSDYYLSRWLAPKFAARSDGELIPIYTLTGANPGHIYFLHKKAYLSPFDNSVNDLEKHYTDERQRRGYAKIPSESFQLLLLDYITKSTFGGIWPRLNTNNPFGDRMMSPGSSNLLGDVLTDGLVTPMFKDQYFDSDGFVSFNSGHALRLGTNTDNYFSSKSTYNIDGVSRSGSWYRIYGNAYGKSHPWDYDNHRSICFNPGTGAFIGRYLTDKGPFSRNGKWSSWSSTSSANDGQLSDKKIRLEFIFLGNKLEEEDSGTEGYRMEVKIGDGNWQKSAVIKEKWRINSNHFQKDKDYFWTFSRLIPNATIVPVVIRVINDRGWGLSDQICSTSKSPFVEEAVFYIDTQHQRAFGEIEGSLQGIQVILGNEISKRPVELKFRIEVE